MRSIINGLAIILLLNSIILVNLSWIFFFVILVAKLLGFVDYPWLALNHLSVIGTPFEMILDAFVCLYGLAIIEVKVDENEIR